MTTLASYLFDSIVQCVISLPNAKEIDLQMVSKVSIIMYGIQTFAYSRMILIRFRLLLYLFPVAKDPYHVDTTGPAVVQQLSTWMNYSCTAD